MTALTFPEQEETAALLEISTEIRARVSKGFCFNDCANELLAQYGFPASRRMTQMAVLAGLFSLQ